MTLMGIGIAICVAVLLLPRVARRRLRRILHPRGPMRSGQEPDAGRAGRPGRDRRRGRGVSDQVEPALVLDLVAVAMAGGLDPRSAVGAAGRSLGRSVDTAGDVDAGLAAIGQAVGDDSAVAELRAALAFSEATGAPAAEMLRSRADDLRRRSVRRAEEAAGRLGVRIVLPLGICILPAFIALGVMPVVLSLIDQLGGIY